MSMLELKRATDQIVELYSKIPNSVLDAIGSEIVLMMRRRVRLGYGVEENREPKKKFAELRPSTIASREKKTLFPGSTPKRSHLTESGQMMDDLGHKKTNDTTVTILFTTQFSSLKAKWAAEGSRNRAKRPFMFLTDAEYKRAVQIAQKYFDDYVDSLK